MLAETSLKMHVAVVSFSDYLLQTYDSWTLTKYLNNQLFIIAMSIH